MDKKRVLVVDDDVWLAKSIEMSLRKRGHEVTALRNGVDAVRCLFDYRPDLIVLDIRLPDCDGWFLAGLLAKLGLTETVPLVVISVLDPDRGKVAEAKPYAYIQKPFDMGQLIQVIEGGLVKQAPDHDDLFAAG